MLHLQEKKKLFISFVFSLQHYEWDSMCKWNSDIIIYKLPSETQTSNWDLCLSYKQGNKQQQAMYHLFHPKVLQIT